MGRKIGESDKLLFYENHLNKDNKFVELIEFPSVQLSNHLNYLCNSDEYYNLFLSKFFDPGVKIIHSLHEFRYHLMNVTKRGQNITENQLQQLITQEKYTEFVNAIQELFLEPLVEYNVEKLIKLVQRGDLKPLDIIVYHHKMPEKGINAFIGKFTLY